MQYRWSQHFHGKKMVGCHFSLIPHYAHQILAGIEHIHSQGIVHRDLKPENILLNGTGNPIIIDFGTAKDLLDTALNGPEFVGTPDFMTPEAVNDKDSSFEADLWTFGGILYQMHTGQTPFQSVSPYMTFLRIKRAKMTRKIGIVDDCIWDLIEKLMQISPKNRLGAGSYLIEEINGKKKVRKTTKNGYDAIRTHPFFEKIESESKMADFQYKTSPSLSDLCMRKCADLVFSDSENLEISDPGDGSSHDLLRLSDSYRKRLMQILDRMHFLHNPRVYRRFFKTRQEARLDKVRPASKDFVGLTIEEFPLEEQQQQMDEGVKVVIKFVYLANPLFLGKGFDDLEENLRYLKECIRKVNKLRPNVVVVCGKGCYENVKVRKLLSKVNESINVVINDGRHFFSIWFSRSIQAVIINKEKLDNNDEGQRQWLDEELEQYRIARNNNFAFCDCDPSTLSYQTKRKLSRAKIRCVYGIGEVSDETLFTQEEFQIDPHVKNTKSLNTNLVSNGNESEESSDEEDDDDFIHKMTLFSSVKSMHFVSIVEESGEMKSELMEVA